MFKDRIISLFIGWFVALLYGRHSPLSTNVLQDHWEAKLYCISVPCTSDSKAFWLNQSFRKSLSTLFWLPMRHNTSSAKMSLSLSLYFFLSLIHLSISYSLVHPSLSLIHPSLSLFFHSSISLSHSFIHSSIHLSLSFTHLSLPHSYTISTAAFFFNHFLLSFKPFLIEHCVIGEIF